MSFSEVDSAKRSIRFKTAKLSQVLFSSTPYFCWNQTKDLKLILMDSLCLLTPWRLVWFVWRSHNRLTRSPLDDGLVWLDHGFVTASDVRFCTSRTFLVTMRRPKAGIPNWHELSEVLFKSSDLSWFVLSHQLSWENWGNPDRGRISWVSTKYLNNNWFYGKWW